MAIAETRMVVRLSESGELVNRIPRNWLTGFRKTSASDSEKHSLSKTSIKTLKNVCIYGFQPQKAAKTKKAAIHTHGLLGIVICLSSQAAKQPKN